MTEFSNSRYRPDIDGLRALAVLSVLLFHAFPRLIPGGFVGVDVFFVISGYLITSILVAEATGGTFSVLQFYIRRARRLFPALLIVLVATAVAGWAFLLQFEFRNLGKHMAAGAGYLSNLLLWREVGYFDPQAESKPLLHLWSLAVEEQFYLVWPAVIWGLCRCASNRLLVGFGVIMVASFAACAVVTSSSQPTAFYMPILRLWELVAGAVVAVIPYWRSTIAPDTGNTGRAPRVRDAASTVGLILIAYALSRNYSVGQFPGLLAGIPVLGTAMIIAAGDSAVPNRWLFSCAPVVYLGRISYPLYLWHWPLLAFAYVIMNGDVGAGQIVCALLVAAALAALTEGFVERPFRGRLARQRALWQAKLLWGALCVSGLAGVLLWTGYLPARSERVAVARQVSAAKLDWLSGDRRSWRGTSSDTVLFIGDSHMQQYVPRLERILGSRRGMSLSVVVNTSSGCAPVGGITRRGTDCAAFVNAAFAEAAGAEVKRIVLAASWAGLASRPDLYRVADRQRRMIRVLDVDEHDILDKWQSQLAAWVAEGKDVVVILSSPRDQRIRPELLYDRWAASPSDTPASYSRPLLSASVSTVDARLRLLASIAGARVIEPFDTLCGPKSCPVVDVSGRPMFTDDSHLNASAAREYATFVDDLVQ